MAVRVTLTGSGFYQGDGFELRQGQTAVLTDDQWDTVPGDIKVLCESRAEVYNGAGVGQIAVITLDGDDLAAGGNVAVSAAPGAGHLVVVDRCISLWTPGGGSIYGTPTLRYVLDGDVKDGNLVELVSLLDKSASVLKNVASNDYQGDPADAVGAAVVLVMGEVIQQSPPAVTVVHAGGSGYAVDDELGVPWGDSDTITVNAVNGSGAVTAFTFNIDGGVFDLFDNPYVTTGGSGTGFTFDVTELEPPDGMLDLRVFYHTVDLEA